MPFKSQGGFLIARIHQISNRIFNKLLKAKETDLINSAQGRILFVLWQNDGIPISDLAQKSGLKKSTLTSMLDRLEERGLIARVPSSDDRRTINIFRTAKDKALQKVYDEVSDEMTALFYRGFSEEEIVAFEKTLQRLLENLQLLE